MKSGVAIILAVTFIATTAVAQSNTTVEHDFEGDNVQGRLVKPSDASIWAPRHVRGLPFKLVRADFVDEIVETVDDI